MASVRNIESRSALLARMTSAGHLVPSGVPGVFGRSGAFESVIECFEGLVTRSGADQDAEVVRFPPVMNRATYEATDHLETMPQLLGVVHGFDGDAQAHAELLSRYHDRADWTDALAATDVVMVPAACYPLYPTATGVLPVGGRTVDLLAFVFRREPSDDPARLQIFRQREFVRLGTAHEALSHRDEWLRRALEMHRSLGLDVRQKVATDAFFGRASRLMRATQREQTLKYELVVPITSDDGPTAITSSNLHADLFGTAFDIRTSGGEVAHTACVGFGLERVALALFATHGMNPDAWPREVRGVLRL